VDDLQKNFDKNNQVFGSCQAFLQINRQKNDICRKSLSFKGLELCLPEVVLSIKRAFRKKNVAVRK
jgi:hypothetical protein